MSDMKKLVVPKCAQLDHGSLRLLEAHKTPMASMTNTISQVTQLRQISLNSSFMTIQKLYIQNPSIVPKKRKNAAILMR
jgi:hypothetical protein